MEPIADRLIDQRSIDSKYLIYKATIDLEP